MSQDSCEEEFDDTGASALAESAAFPFEQYVGSVYTRTVVSDWLELYPQCFLTLPSALPCWVAWC